MRRLLPLVACLFVAACAKPQLRAAPVVEAAPRAPSAPQAAPPEKVEERAPVVEATPAPAEPEVLRAPVVYFGFDSTAVDPESRQALDVFGKVYLGRAPRPFITIEGHADERGTEEYNLILGEKRASAVKGYLVRLGAIDKALKTVSFGEARPAVRGEADGAWAQNRRAELRIDGSK